MACVFLNIDHKKKLGDSLAVYMQLREPYIYIYIAVTKKKKKSLLGMKMVKIMIYYTICSQFVHSIG